jgi:hypothetical protein
MKAKLTLVRVSAPAAACFAQEDSAHINDRRRLETVPSTSLRIRCQKAADRGEKSVLKSIEPGFLGAA